MSCFGHDCYMLAFGVPALLMILSIGDYRCCHVVFLFITYPLVNVIFSWSILFSYPTLPPYGLVISFRPQLFKGWIVLCNRNITINFNNCITKWRLGAWDILKLPLLAACAKTKTAQMAGRQWKVEERGERGLLNTQYKVLLLPTTPTKKLYNPKDKERDAYSSITKSLTTIHSYCLPHSHLLVNSVKIHLTWLKLDKHVLKCWIIQSIVNDIIFVK